MVIAMTISVKENEKFSLVKFGINWRLLLAAIMSEEF